MTIPAQFDAKTIEKINGMPTGWKQLLSLRIIDTYTIVIPPPNVTESCTWDMLNNTIQDVLIRRARLKGFNACWVPEQTIMLRYHRS
jgi:valyl-tRNA synthetase